MGRPNSGGNLQKKFGDSSQQFGDSSQQFGDFPRTAFSSKVESTLEHVLSFFHNVNSWLKPTPLPFGIVKPLRIRVSFIKGLSELFESWSKTPWFKAKGARVMSDNPRTWSCSTLMDGMQAISGQSGFLRSTTDAELELELKESSLHKLFFNPCPFLDKKCSCYTTGILLGCFRVPTQELEKQLRSTDSEATPTEADPGSQRSAVPSPDSQPREWPWKSPSEATLRYTPGAKTAVARPSF